MVCSFPWPPDLWNQLTDLPLEIWKPTGKDPNTTQLSAGRVQVTLSSDDRDPDTASLASPWGGPTSAYLMGGKSKIPIAQLTCCHQFIWPQNPHFSLYNRKGTRRSWVMEMYQGPGRTNRARARTKANHTFISLCDRATGALIYRGTFSGYSGRVVCISMVTGTVWERRLKGGQMERLFGLQGGICGASRVQTKVDWAPEVKTHLPQGEEDSLTWWWPQLWTEYAAYGEQFPGGGIILTSHPP